MRISLGNQETQAGLSLPIAEISNTGFLNQVVTTDAVPKFFDSYLVSQDTIIFGLPLFSASNADGTDCAAFGLGAQIVAARINGVLSLVTPVGPQAPFFNIGPTSATWTVEYATSGEDFQVIVKGAAGVTVKWAGGIAISDATSPLNS